MSNYKRGEMVWVFYYDENDKAKIDHVSVTDYWEDTKQIYYSYDGGERSAFLIDIDRSREALIDRQIDRISNNFTEYVDEITQKIKELNEYAISIQSDLKHLTNLKEEQA